MKTVLGLLLCLSSSLANATPREELGWLPASYVSAASTGSVSFIARWIESNASQIGGLPPCWDVQSKRLEGSYMLSQGKRNVQAFRAPTAVRDEVEQCVLDLLAKMTLRGERRHDGALTELSAAGRSSSWVGWAKDGWVFWDDDRAVVAELVAAVEKPGRTLSIGWLLDKIPSDAPFWAACALDYTSGILKVPSRAFYMSGKLDPGKKLPLLNVVFANPADAKRAVTAIRGAANNPALSAQLREVIGHVAPEARGAEMQLVPSFLVDDIPKLEGVMNEITAQLKKLQ